MKRKKPIRNHVAKKPLRKRTSNQVYKLKIRFRIPFWFYRFITIAALSSILGIILFREIFSDLSQPFIRWFSRTVLLIGLIALTVGNWILLRNSKRYRKNILYKAFYHFSTIITSVFIFIALCPLIAKECGARDNWLFNYQIDTLIALLWGALYAIDFIFFQCRWTYRVLPNFFISASLFIMYSLIISISIGKGVIFDLDKIDQSIKVIFLDDNITKWLGWGIVGSILTTLVGKATEDVWYGMSRSATGDYAKINYRFKQQRRKLLTYRGGRITRIGCLQVVFVCLIPIIGCFILFGKEGNAQKVLGQIYFIGVALAVMGFLLHQFITDENLLRSENDYVSDRRQAAEDSWAKKDAPCGSPAWEWMSYCQVITNIYCSRSPIFHQNELYHGVKTLMPDSIIGKEVVCPIRLIADLIQMFEEQYELYCSEEAPVEQREIELQLADNVIQYINEIVDENSVTQWSDNVFIFEVIKQIFDVYFDIIKEAFRVDGVPFEDVKKLLVFDYLKRIVNEQGENGREKRSCRMAWWCQSQESSYYQERWEQGETMRQLLPYETAELLIDRWGKDLVPRSGSSIEEVFLDTVEAYEGKWKPAVDYWVSLDSTDKDKLDDRKEQLKQRVKSIKQKTDKEKPVQCVP